MRLRFFVGILIISLMASLTCTFALADVIWTPNDSFYEKEYQNCVYIGRSYLANGENGSITVFRVPAADETVAVINNGSEFYVSYSYTDQAGERWGVVEFTYDEFGNVMPEYSVKGETGWIRMTDLSLIYDYISFAEDHQSEFIPYAGTYEEFEADDKIVFWSYPGSGVSVWSVDALKIDNLFSLTQTYTDTENRLWGFVDYYYGFRNGWVCISNQAGNDIEVVQTPTPEKSHVSASPDSETTASRSNEKPVVQNDSIPLLLIIAIAVVVLVAVTGVIIMVFWKKNTKKDQAIK